MSGSQVARLERAEVPAASVLVLARLFAVLGMRLSARTFPAGPSIRDAAHIRLLERFRAGLPPTIRLRTEVPLRVKGDLRAWDGELAVGEAQVRPTPRDDRCVLEAETALYDLQATERRIALKMTDDGVERVILLVADTHRNRRVLREFRSHLAPRFPLGAAAVMRELRAGRLPPQSGIVVR